MKLDQAKLYLLRHNVANALGDFFEAKDKNKEIMTLKMMVAHLINFFLEPLRWRCVVSADSRHFFETDLELFFKEPHENPFEIEKKIRIDFIKVLPDEINFIGGFHPVLPLADFMNANKQPDNIVKYFCRLIPEYLEKLQKNVPVERERINGFFFREFGGSDET